MKKALFLLLGVYVLSVYPSYPSQAFSQSYTTSYADSLTSVQISRDTLPGIEMKFEPWIFLFSPLYIGGHSYRIDNRKHYFASNTKPYFQATRDPLLTDLYRRHEINRYVWYSASTLGSLVAAIGFVRRLKATFIIPYYESTNDNYLYWAGGISLAGLGARIVTFRNMRKVVNYYNLKYAGTKSPVTLSIGPSHFAPGSAGVSLKF